MGQTIKANCENCDFTTEFDFGSGMMNFAFYTPVPAIEINTGQFKNPNYKKVEKHSNYYFYSDDKLKIVTSKVDTPELLS